jgi:hypothetical protein
MFITFCTYAVHSSKNTPITFAKKIQFLLCYANTEPFPAIPSSTLFVHTRYKKRWSSDSSLWAVSYIQQMNLCAVSQPALPLDQAILRSIEQLTGEEARYLHLTYLLLGESSYQSAMKAGRRYNWAVYWLTRSSL